MSILRGFKHRVRVRELRERIWAERGNLAASTLKNYRWFFEKLESYSEYWPSVPSEVNGFISSLDGLNDSSVRQLYKTFRAFGRYTKRTYGWADPTENAECPRVKRKNRRYFSSAELTAVIGACRNVREKALILALLDSSARIGELASLRVAGLRDGFIMVSGKTGERHYRCDAGVVAMLREIAIDGVVFPKNNSSRQVIYPVLPASGVNLGDRVKWIFKRAGLTGSKLGPHTLRHTAASLVAKETGSALAVKALLQHDNIATSMLYIHDVEDSIQQVTSPMSLAGVASGLDFSPGRALVPALPMVSDGIDVSSLLPSIPDGLWIRPGLTSEDLRLIRDGFIELMHVRGEFGVGARSVQLLKRILCRVH
jgi:integrase/recombinase XerD